MALHRAARIGLALSLFGLSSPAFAAFPLPKIIVDPTGAMAGDYKLDPHHASVTAKLAHMGLSRYTLRFDGVDGHFAYDPRRPAATQ